jgi:hypothetical protein
MEEDGQTMRERGGNRMQTRSTEWDEDAETKIDAWDGRIGDCGETG